MFCLLDNKQSTICTMFMYFQSYFYLIINNQLYHVYVLSNFTSI